MTDTIYTRSRYDIHDLDGPPEKLLNKSKMATEREISDGILACVKITNLNLINMQKRLNSSKREVARIILQTEANSIFKGNMIRVLKQLYNSPTINVIKSNMSYIIDLDSIHPIIIGIHVKWPELPDWRSKEYHVVRRAIMDAFLYMSYGEIEDQAIASLKETAAEEKKVLITQLPNKAPSFDTISFDSLKQIKFTVK